MTVHKFPLRASLMGVSLLALAACGGDVDFDLRRFGDGFSTSAAAREAKTASRPTPDARGVISYPTYQVAVAQKGDTLITLAQRVGLPVGDVARYNGLKTDAALRAGEIVALPRRVAADAAATIKPSAVDVTTLAGDALDQIGPSPAPAETENGEAPTRHQVQRGETAYSIARLYGVSARALAEWNSLDSALSVREGQYLLIPVVIEPAPVQTAAVTQPGQGSSVPLPPSASTALPDEKTTPVATAEAAPAPTPADLGATRTSASSAKMSLPVDGSIVKAFVKGKTDGVDISASAGAPVKAAAEGTVAAITKDTEGVPILVLKHTGNLLTVYAGIENISVAKGAKVSRGQNIAAVRAGSNALHFQVREGTTSVDPLTYLN